MAPSAHIPWRGSPDDRERQQVFGAEHARLFEDIPAHFGERQSIGRRFEVFEPAGGLDRLKGDAAPGGLLQREVDDSTKLLVVEPLSSA